MLFKYRPEVEGVAVNGLKCVRLENPATMLQNRTIVGHLPVSLRWTVRSPVAPVAPGGPAALCTAAAAFKEVFRYICLKD